jgi:hypothetical protein
MHGMILRVGRAMKRSRSPLTGALPTLALVLVIGTTIAQAAAVPLHAADGEARCSDKGDIEKALNAFQEGKELFQRRRWLEAEIQFLLALECSGTIKKKVRLYGRWRDDFDPETYLGLTMHRMGCCLAPGRRSCPLVSDWHGDWEGFLRSALASSSDLLDHWDLARVNFPEQQSCGIKVQLLTSNGVPRGSGNVCAMPECLLVGGSRVVYCPVIDWWTKLVAGDVALEKVVSTQCAETATLTEKLWTALHFGGDPADGSNRHVCEAMVRELARVEEGCGGR